MRAAHCQSTLARHSDGNLTQVTGPSGTEQLAYDAHGALVVRYQGANKTIYVGNEMTIRLMGTTQSASVHIVLGETRVASRSSVGSVLYYHRDHLGSIIATSLAGGVAGALYRYGAYGSLDRVAGETSSNASELGYIGALRLSEGLLYLNARVYNPQMRRFLQPDTMDLRRYTYAAGDPVNLVDPSGRDPEPGTTLKCERDCGSGPEDPVQPLPTLEDAEAAASWSTTITVTTVESQSTVSVAPPLVDTGPTEIPLGPAPITFGPFAALAGSMTHVAPRGGDSGGGGGASAAPGVLLGAANLFPAMTRAEASQALLNEAMSGGGVEIRLKDPLRHAATLVSRFGGNAGDWVKMTTRNFFLSGKGAFDAFQIHFYRNVVTGQNVEAYTKFTNVAAAGTTSGAGYLNTLSIVRSLGVLAPTMVVGPIGYMNQRPPGIDSCVNPTACSQ